MKINIKSKIKRLFKSKSRYYELLEISKEIYAKSLLSRYMPKNYFPVSDSSLKFHSLLAIVNDIIINKRKSYIEFGTGLSTIVIAKLAKENNLDLKITAVDHDIEWIKILTNILKLENLTSVNLLYAPLIKTDFCLGDNYWYDGSILNKFINNSLFDSVLIDGPPAYENDIRLARYPAIPYIINKLEKKSIIFLDDTGRVGEKTIIRIWEKKYLMKFKKVSDSFSFSIKGEGFHFRLL